MIAVCNALNVRPGVHDGASTFTLNLLQHLPAASPETRFIAYVQEGEDRIATRENLEVRQVGITRGGAGRILWEMFALSGVLREVRADVLLSPHESIPLFPPCAVVVVAQNLVYHADGVTDTFRGEKWQQRAVSRLQAHYYRVRMTRAYRRASTVVAVSATTANELARHARLDPGTTIVVHEGSDSMFLPGPQRNPIRADRLLAVSTISPYKNLPSSVDLLVELRRQRPELVLDIVGADWRGYRRHIEQHAEARGVAAAVHFMDGVEPGQLGAFYERSRLLLHLSSCESFGLPTIEAMRFGLPVVAANRSSLPEVTAGAALLVDPDDLPGMTMQVGELLDDAGAQAKLAELGRRRADALTWRSTAEGVARVLEATANAPGRDR